MMKKLMSVGIILASVLFTTAQAADEKAFLSPNNVEPRYLAIIKQLVENESALSRYSKEYRLFETSSLFHVNNRSMQKMGHML